jgi:hypothetical protein
MKRKAKDTIHVRQRFRLIPYCSHPSWQIVAISNPELSKLLHAAFTTEELRLLDKQSRFAVAVVQAKTKKDFERIAELGAEILSENQAPGWKAAKQRPRR